MARALKVCSRPGCPNLCQSGRCPDCRREADTARGTAAERGYGGRHWRTQRRACLRRDPICVCTDPTHGHGARCYLQSTDADHDPVERRELVALGVPDPDALEYLKGKCSPCHKRRTAAETPGGWHAPVD